MRALIMMTIVINKLMFSKWWNTSTWAKNKIQNAKCKMQNDNLSKMESANLSERTGWAGRTQLSWEGWRVAGHPQCGFLTFQLLFNYNSIIFQLLFNYCWEGWWGAGHPQWGFLSIIVAIRQERYMIISCRFFFTFQWTNHNSFGHISFPSSFHCLMINWIFCQHLKYLLMLGHDYHSIQLLVCICVCAHIHLPGLQRGCRKKTI